MVPRCDSPQQGQKKPRKRDCGLGGKEADIQEFGREGEHRGRAVRAIGGEAREKSQGLQTGGGPSAPEAHAVPFS